MYDALKIMVKITSLPY